MASGYISCTLWSFPGLMRPVRCPQSFRNKLWPSHTPSSKLSCQCRVPKAKFVLRAWVPALLVLPLPLGSNSHQSTIWKGLPFPEYHVVSVWNVFYSSWLRFRDPALISLQLQGVALSKWCAFSCTCSHHAGAHFSTCTFMTRLPDPFTFTEDDLLEVRGQSCFSLVS